MITALRLCHLPTTLAGTLTDQGLVAGSRGEKAVSSNIVNNSAAGLNDEFVPDISSKWECMILLTIMAIMCMSGCWVIFIDAAHC